MIKLQTPRGLPVDVPEELAEDPSPRFQLTETSAIRAYYAENGYVVVPKLISEAVCDELRGLWAGEVKGYSGCIYRQATAKAERHRVNEKGWVMNPVLNLQSVDPAAFPKFRTLATEKVLAAPALRDVFNVLLGNAPKIVQSMYFEGNSATWEHQDTYYLDSEVPGEMVGAWIALEDIRPRAGRFFVCPKSHKIELKEQGVDNNIVDHHEDYILSVVDEIRRRKLEIRAPRLDKGDVLLWHSRTIHGSLDSQDTDAPRSSVTCHAIPQGRQLLQLQTRRIPMKGDDVQGTEVCRPKDLAKFSNQMVFAAETHFPKAFHMLKRSAIRVLVHAKK